MCTESLMLHITINFHSATYLSASIERKLISFSYLRRFYDFLNERKKHKLFSKICIDKLYFYRHAIPLYKHKRSGCKSSMPLHKMCNTLYLIHLHSTTVNHSTVARTRGGPVSVCSTLYIYTPQMRNGNKIIPKIHRNTDDDDYRANNTNSGILGPVR